MLTTGETWNGRYTKSFHQVGLPEDSRGTTPKRWISSNFWNGLFVVLHLASCNPLPLTRNTTRDAAVALWGLPHYKDLFLDDSEEWEEFEPEIPEIPSNIPGPTPGPPCVLDRTWCQAACAGRRPTRNGCTSRGTPGPTWTAWCSPDWESKHHGYTICINNGYTVYIICINMYIICI